MRIFADVLIHAAAAAAGLAVIAVPTALGAAVLCVASRVAYLVYTAVSIRDGAARLDTDPRERQEMRHAGFKRRVVWLQNIDGMMFAVLCFVTRGTLPAGDLTIAAWLSAGLLIVAGVACKVWAVRTLGNQSFTWGEFFVRQHDLKPCRSGPYRFLSAPMYTVGYLHPYGIALALLSWPGLAAAAFLQVAILLFNVLVETPLFRQVYARSAPQPAEVETAA